VLFRSCIMVANIMQVCYDSPMNTYNLPRGYLSWSAYSLWKKSKDQYRKRYYLNEDSFETRETRFGKHVGKKVEDGESVHVDLLQYSVKEHPIVVDCEGVTLKGYIDQFNPETCSILEMKTGHLNPQGKVPWDNIKVRKHGQLPFYSLMVELKYGKVDPVVVLQWLETEFKIEETEFDGHVLKAPGSTLKLTGRIETFKRTIEPWEREKIKGDILLVAKEITEDYEKFIKGTDQRIFQEPSEGITQEKSTI